jgi:NAD(P)-dependent dehydrogenase (short-subunit alcohol dehydrogenase family)
LRFQDKVALITGGTSGIGFSTAKLLASEGASVVIVGRNERKGSEAIKELHSISSKLLFVAGDVTNARDVEGFVSQTLSTFGRMDFAFNNAANADKADAVPTHELREEIFDYHLNTTLKSVWLCMKYEIAAMLEQDSKLLGDKNKGSIVNTSSLDALICSAGTAIYAAGKSGVIAMSKALAQEYGPYGIRVNSLCPGAFKTPMLERFFKGLSNEETEQLTNRFNSLSALGRIGRPEEAADVVAWLFSNESSYVTGQNIIVDGGVTVLR